jgi:hypothetical protein
MYIKAFKFIQFLEIQLISPEVIRCDVLSSTRVNNFDRDHLQESRSG